MKSFYEKKLKRLIVMLELVKSGIVAQVEKGEVENAEDWCVILDDIKDDIKDCEMQIAKER